MRASSPVQASLPSARAAGTLRAFLLVIAALVYLGVVIELWFTDHTMELLQILPFVVCLAAFAVVASALLRPRRPTLRLVRATLPFVVAVSLLGMYEHMHANYEFEREIRPNASTLSSFEKSLHGVAPILAPGSLGLAGVLAVAATWQHPLLTGPDEES